MDIVIIANFASRLDGKSYGRFTYLAEMLSEQGHNVELITSTFIHGLKKQGNQVTGKFKSKITLINEPGYKRNICLKRFYSHYAWGRNVYSYLKSKSIKPDLVYCAIPSMTVAVKCAKYCNKHNIKFTIDIQDLWPEAFAMVVKNKFLQSFFKPLEWYINKAYHAAGVIVAVSQTYINRATRVNNKATKTLSVFLGNDGSYFDDVIPSYPIRKDESNIWIAYIGSMGDSYDLECVIQGIKKFQDKTNTTQKVSLILCGDGEKRHQFEESAKLNEVHALFLGGKPYDEMVSILCACDITVNPIVKGSAASVINKVGDYALSGLPVINTQECREYRDLVEKYNCGINCECGNAQDVANAIEKLCLDEDLRKTMGKNHRKLGEERFDRRITYQRIIDFIIN